MREKLWLFFRESNLVRKLYSLPGFSRPMRFMSSLLVPFSSQKRIRVRAGPAKGLVFELDSRWEHHTWDGRYEREALAQFLAHIGTGARVFDIGGGIGHYSLVAARAGARVITFEPDPLNARSLERYAALNGLAGRIQIVRQAVFSHTGNVALVRSDGMSAHHNSKVETNPLAESTFEVAATTLDAFVGNGAGPDLIKLDVEGAESNVFRGAEQVFRLHKPIVLCEVHDETNAVFIRAWLDERRYTFRWIEPEAAYPRHFLAMPPKDQ